MPRQRSSDSDAGRAMSSQPMERYQRYDRLNRRQGWQAALGQLREDVNAGRQPVDRQETARRFGLPADWTWRDVEHKLAGEARPLEAFNSLLRVLFRGLD